MKIFDAFSLRMFIFQNKKNSLPLSVKVSICSNGTTGGLSAGDSTWGVSTINSKKKKVMEEL